MHRSQQVLRSAVGPISSRINNALSSPSSYATISERAENVFFGGQIEDPVTALHDPAQDSTFNGSTNTLQPASFSNEPVHLRDVRAIQSRVGGVFDALQTSDHMSPAQLSLIKTVRETASDPDVLSKIVNNGSFQEFMTLYVPTLLTEHQAQLPESSSSILGGDRRAVIVEEYESEQEYAPPTSFAYSSSSSSSTTSEQQFYDSNSDDETNFLRGRSRRMYSAEDNSAQQRALNRLNELCHQISPDFASPPAEQRFERPLSPAAPEPVVSKPTMEGPGMPGLSAQVPEQVPEQPSPPETPQWANPVYLFVVTACVIPITILAVTAVVYPSPKTWSLLKSGFKAVCNKILA